MRRLVIWVLIVLMIIILGLPALIGLFETKPPPPAGPEITVYFTDTGETKTIALEEYLVRVVAAEMPASFDLEALKAQAVAARTYTLRRQEWTAQKPDPHHPQAAVCTDPGHCQAYISDEAMQAKWGALFYIHYRQKIEEAVKSTYRQVLVYHGELIDPAYHANSGGRTANSEEVWPSALPYLTSVPSPWDTEAPHATETRSISTRELNNLLNLNLPLDRPPDIALLSRTPSGRVREAELGGRRFTGLELREKLDLNSTFFTWQQEDQGLTLVTTGKGHGVGLSQYGADFLGRQGRTYQEILTYYYSGVELAKYPY